MFNFIPTSWLRNNHLLASSRWLTYFPLNRLFWSLKMNLPPKIWYGCQFWWSHTSVCPPREYGNIYFWHDIFWGKGGRIPSKSENSLQVQKKGFTVVSRWILGECPYRACIVCTRQMQIHKILCLCFLWRVFDLYLVSVK